MDPKFQLIWFLFALICFVVAALRGVVVRNPETKAVTLAFSIDLVPLGLACFTVVFFWSAWKAV